jgi:hypothetical protein
MRCPRNETHTEEKRNICIVLIRKPERRRPLGRYRCRREVNIKMGLREIGRDDMDWINLAKDRNQ